MKTPFAPAAVAALLAALAAVPAQAQQVIDLSKIVPQCVEPGFKKDPVGGKCVAEPEAIAEPSAAKCEAAGFKFDTKTAKCGGTPAKDALPTCGSDLPDLAVKDGKCVVERRTPRTLISDYLGDCFYIGAVPTSKAFPFKGGQYIKVLEDKEAPGGKDKTLNVALSQGFFPYFGCKAVDNAPIYQLSASEIAATGALRFGWTYGVLAMPYKFYKGSKTLGDGVTVGPYLGWRRGEPGAGMTFAVSVGLSKVKGEVRDAQDKITSTPDLAAISAAAGVMWDLSKAQGLKPFKLGLFVGSDRVSTDNVVKFRQNGKGWVALQIGYDFTDN